MVEIIKVSDEFFTEFDKWRNQISEKNKLKKPLSRPEASDLLRPLLPDLDISIMIMPSTKKKNITSILDLNQRRRAR